MKTKTSHFCTILWADDDTDDQSVVRGIVEAEGDNYQIREVGNGLQVFEYLNAASGQVPRPCLVVLDINMPLLNGKEALTRIKTDAKFSDLPVAVFTTSNSEEDRLFCNRYGVPMITKPNTYRAFVDAVMRLLAMCSYRSQERAIAN